MPGQPGIASPGLPQGPPSMGQPPMAPGQPPSKQTYCFTSLTHFWMCIDAHGGMHRTAVLQVIEKNLTARLLDQWHSYCLACIYIYDTKRWSKTTTTSAHTTCLIRLNMMTFVHPNLQYFSPFKSGDFIENQWKWAFNYDQTKLKVGSAILIVFFFHTPSCTCPAHFWWKIKTRQRWHS